MTAPTCVTGAHARETPAVVARSLTFSFPFGREVIHDFNLELPAGSRCLLTGANGAGKPGGGATGSAPVLCGVPGVWGSVQQCCAWLVHASLPRPADLAAMPVAPPSPSTSCVLHLPPRHAQTRAHPHARTLPPTATPSAPLPHLTSLAPPQARPRCCRCWRASSWWDRMLCACWAAQPSTTSSWCLRGSSRTWGPSGAETLPLLGTTSPCRRVAGAGGGGAGQGCGVVGVVSAGQECGPEQGYIVYKGWEKAGGGGRV